MRPTVIRLIAGGALGTAFSVSLMLPGALVFPEDEPPTLRLATRSGRDRSCRPRRCAAHPEGARARTAARCRSQGLRARGPSRPGGTRRSAPPGSLHAVTEAAHVARPRLRSNGSPRLAATPSQPTNGQEAEESEEGDEGEERQTAVGRRRRRSRRKTSRAVGRRRRRRRRVRTKATTREARRSAAPTRARAETTRARTATTTAATGVTTASTVRIPPVAGC